MLGVKMARGLKWTLETAVEFLKAIHMFEEMNKKPITKDLEKLVKADYTTIMRYRDALRALGLIQTETTRDGVIIKLTEKGRCIVRCLS